MKDSKVYFQIIIDSIITIEEYTKGINSDMFLENKMIFDACVTQLWHIGETARKYREHFGDISDLPLQEMIGLRNIIAHDYLGISSSLIFTIIETDLPVLKQKLLSLT